MNIQSLDVFDPPLYDISLETINEMREDAVSDESEDESDDESIKIKEGEINNLKVSITSLVSIVKKTANTLNKIRDKLKASNESLGALKKAKADITASYDIIYNASVSTKLAQENDKRSVFLSDIYAMYFSSEIMYNKIIGELEQKETDLSKKLRDLMTFINSDIYEKLQTENVPRLNITSMCIICMDSQVNAVLIPCGHTACYDCARNLGRCHICREGVRTRHKFFIG